MKNGRRCFLLDAAVLTAGLAAMCCRNAQPLGSGPPADAGTDAGQGADTDADTETDTQTEADTDLDVGCPEWTGDSCPTFFDETAGMPLLIAADDLPLAGTARFVDLEIATSGFSHASVAIGILAEVELGDGQWTPAVLSLDLSDPLWNEAPVVAIAQGEPLPESHEAVALVDQPPEGLEWSFVALTCSADACRIDGVAEVDGPLAPISTLALAPDERVNGMAGLGNEVIAFGTRLRSSPDLIEWTEIDEVGEGAALNDFENHIYWFYDGIPHGAAVGDDGRMVEYLDGEWIEHAPSTGSDLRTVLVDSDRFFAAGDDGALVAVAQGYPELCELMELDFTAMSSGDALAHVGTAGGDVLQLDYPEVDWGGGGTCLLPAVGAPVLELRYMRDGDRFWLLTLTEDALYAALILMTL